MSPIMLALLGTTFTFLATAFGAATVYLFRKEIPQRIQRIFLGFAAGVMIAASVWSLLIPAMEMAAEQNVRITWLPAAGGFVLGGLFLLVLDHLLPHMHPGCDEPEGLHCSFRRTTMLVLAVTLHNIPEGLAVGLALQGALTNFAGGLMIILFKPFRVGDYIECSGAEGIVKDISIFYTIIVTLDNIRISIPNGDLMNSAISNYSIEKIRRIDLDFKVTNDCDGDEARKVLLDAASNTPGILHEPEPFTRLSAVDDDTYIYTVRVWVDAEKYWDVYFDVLEHCSKALNDNGIDDPEERIAVRIVKDEQ